MTDNEINIKIAEACGWKSCVKTGWGFSAPMEYPAHELNGNVVFDSQLPDYCNDLNAMYNVENTLSGDEYLTYWEKNLPLITGALDFGFEGSAEYNYRISHATPLQRAKAFLKVKGLFKE